jgi:hypothetical protein
MWKCQTKHNYSAKPQCQGLRQSFYRQGSNFDYYRTYFLQTHFHLVMGGLLVQNPIYGIIFGILGGLIMFFSVDYSN